MDVRKGLLVAASLLLACLPARAIQISEVMYHPKTDELHGEWVEIYNEKSAREDLSGWQFTAGFTYTFPADTVLDPRAYLVIAIDPNAIATSYGITNVVGPFTAGRLDNDSDHIVLRDNAGGILAELDYQDSGKWPLAPDGAGYALAKFVMRGDPMDPDNWRTSAQLGGTPGRDNGFQSTFVDADLISAGETWRYFKGVTEASTPIDAWRQRTFDDSSWTTGPTGIGYADGDDATILTDMQQGVPPGNPGYLSIFCRKKFTVPNPSAIDRLILEVDHDDGFAAYVNGSYIGNGAMPDPPYAYNTPAFLHAGRVEGGAPTVIDLTSSKTLLNAGENVLAIQVHNNQLGSSDLTFIPRLTNRIINQPGQLGTTVLINEVSFNTSDTQFIELYNKTGGTINLGGYGLSNDPNSLFLYQITSPTLLASNNRIAFQESQLGFHIRSASDRILLTSNGGAVLDGRVVEAGRLDMSEGRWPDGNDEWYYMERTTGTANVVTLTTSVVINEIMYHPPTENVLDEFIEIYNAGATPVNLTGWSFTRGVSYDFTTDTVIAPGQHLVIARDRARLIARYSLTSDTVLGNYTGQLDDGGERIRLRDAFGNVADELVYSEGGHWSPFADGYGSSLELIDARQDNTNYQAWAPSDERSKAQWTFYSYSATYSPNSNPELQELQINLLGEGVVLIDDIRIERSSTNYLAPGDFEAGLGNWLCLGTHVQSSVTTEDSHGGSRCLKIIATGRGDTGANHIEHDASPVMAVGAQNTTISFWAKWQWGNRVLHTEIVNFLLPETHMLDIPLVTGTPGAANSVRQANLGPVFRKVAHAPAIPTPAQTARVTARAFDPDGVASVSLFHKADADAAYASVPMYDDGAHGDGNAGDGLWAGDIPARAAGQVVAFYLQGTDGLGVSHTWPTNTARPALYRVESATASSNLAVYRAIMTAADETLMFNGRPHLSNEELNCTFIFNEQDVYYNCGVRFIGSPFHRAGTGYTGYKISFNADEKLHGVKEMVRVDKNPNGSFHDHISYDLQRWMGLPHCDVEWIHLRLNGRNEGTLEDTVPPGASRYTDTFYRGDADGHCFEVDDRFAFTNDNDTLMQPFSNTNADFAWLGPDKDPYRHNFEIRNHDNDDDYTSIILMLDILNRSLLNEYQQRVATIINVEQWFKLFAIRACLSDWDFIAFTRGKNCYLYYPPAQRRWDLLGWDSELTFGTTNMSIWSNFTTIRNFQQRGGHTHYYYMYLHQMLDMYFTRAKMDPWMDHYGTVIGAGAGGEKSFIDARRTYLLNQIAPYVNVTPAITTNGGFNFTTRFPNVALAGMAPAQVRWARIGGIDYLLNWSSATAWGVDLVLAPGPNNIVMQFLDYDKRLVGTDFITITYELPADIGDWRAY